MMLLFVSDYMMLCQSLDYPEHININSYIHFIGRWLLTMSTIGQKIMEILWELTQNQRSYRRYQILQ